MEVDVVIHLGDYIYENRPSVPGSSYWPAFLATGRQQDPAYECLSLLDYRPRYAKSRTHTILQEFLPGAISSGNKAEKSDFDPKKLKKHAAKCIDMC